MNIYMARQPIFDSLQKVYGYELLYRTNALVNEFDYSEADTASSSVIIDSFYGIGIEKLTYGKKAFINFTDNLLQNEIATLFPNNILVVEILESVEPDPELVLKCTHLKQLGYEIALDDFVFQPGMESLIGLVDIIKIDFRNTPIPAIAKYIMQYRRPGLRFLAEKIETKEEYDTAHKLGFRLFQGFFFSKPSIVTELGLRPLPTNCVRLIKASNVKNPDTKLLAKLIMQDVSLSYKLLRLVNTVAFGFRYRIQSVQHALVALGITEVRKWISLVSMIGINTGQPEELLRLSLLRAKTVEALAPLLGLGGKSQALFMMGLFSMLEAIMGHPFEEIFREVSVDENVFSVLVWNTGPFVDINTLIIAHERGDWDEAQRLCDKLGITLDIVTGIYMESLTWCDSVFGESLILE